VIEVPLDPVSYSLARAILARLPPKHYIAYAPMPLGFRGLYPVGQLVVVGLPGNSIVVDISVLFRLLTNETQTAQITILYHDGSAYTFEISASSAEGAVVEKRLGNYQYLLAMRGMYPGQQELVGPKILTGVTARAKTNLSTGSTQPALLVRYYTIG
jgi:hypothetical protein